MLVSTLRSNIRQMILLIGVNRYQPHRAAFGIFQYRQRTSVNLFGSAVSHHFVS